MTFDDILAQILDILKRQGRVSYSALKRRFDLDDDYLNDLQDELLFAHPVVDEDKRGLVWTGATASVKEVIAPPTQPTQPLAAQQQPSLQVTPLPTVPPAPDAERRQLTVMFCDLVDSTSLAGRLDPEDYRDVVRAYQTVCTEVIRRYDGHIAQLLGDGLLVYFGYPQAHEDDALRAVRAGLGILDVMGELSTRLQQDKGIQLAVRLGIHTGLVVIGEMGEAGRQEQLALGETPNIAARIQGLARPNTLVVSEATYRLVEGYFTCESLEEHALRGVTQSLRVYRVVGASGVYGRLDIASARGLTPLVGREQEVGLLLERWAQVKAGQGQVVLLTGDAGIGKSRLVQMLKDHVANEPHVRWECRSVEYSQNTALFPLTDLFQRLLRFQADETPHEKFGKLEHALSQYRLPLEESVPLFAPLLSFSLPESRYAPLNLSPQRQQQKTLETIVAILLELAERQSVLFIVEDLHWTDPTTLELLNLLIEQTPTASLLVLLTCRPHFQPTWHHRSYLTEITVNRLSHTQVEQIVHRMTDGKTFPAEVLQQIRTKTDGVPLFVEELTKAILESGQLTAVDGHYELTRALSTFAIPATLQDSLMARLDRLVTAKGIAQIGATIGRQFSYVLLQIVSQVDNLTLQRELGRLVEAELLYQRGLPPQATYTFKHTLIQDAAYQSLLRSTRQQYHQQIAQVLEARFPDIRESQPELLAHHYTEAGLSAQAMPYWQRAGQRALARSGYREAVACFEQALIVLRRLPERRDTLEQAIDLRFDLRNALLPLGEQARMFEHLREAETLAQVLDDRQRLGQVAVFMTEYFRMMNDLDRAVESGQRALTLATTLGDVGLRVVANFYVGSVYYNRGDYDQALDCLRWNVASLAGDLIRERFGMTGLPSVLSRAFLSLALAELGEFAAGTATGEEGVRIAATLEHPFSLIWAYFGIGKLYIDQGNVPQGIVVLERSLELCRVWDIPTLFPQIARVLGTAYALSGRVSEALPLLEQTLAQGIRSSQWVAHLSKGYLLAGRTQEALTCAQQALALAQEHKQRGDQAHALHLLGEIAGYHKSLEVEQANAYYSQALVLAQELGMRPLAAHCHRGLGTLYAHAVQRAQARTELSAALELYRAMEMTFWLPQAEAALAQVGGQ